MPAIRVLSLVLALTVFQGVARAETPNRSKVSLQLQSFKDGETISRGMMFGLRSTRYIQRTQMNVGLEFMAGSPQGGRLDADNLTYGGVSVGYDGTFGTIFAYDFSLLTGYGYGRLDAKGINGHSLTLQPTVAVGLTLLNGYRATFAVGYLYMPSASGFSNFTFGIRLEEKSDSYSNGINH